MSIKGFCVYSTGNFAKSLNYINKKGDHPEILSTIGWDKIVLKKEGLDEKKWLYIGGETEEGIKNQLTILEMHKGFVIISE